MGARPDSAPAARPDEGPGLTAIPDRLGATTRRAGKAYEQVADRLRELIRNGELAPGERLPNETLLAGQFGVSRATIREALRALAAQSLLRTAKGAGGGSYVMVPTADHVSQVLRSNLDLLADARNLTLEELIEARELLEVPAARLAARRRSADDVERLRGSIPVESIRLDAGEELRHNTEFHTVLIRSCGNTLLYIAAQPVFSALQTNLSRSGLGRGFHRRIHEQHARIAEAVEAGDEHGAGSEMRDHLRYLAPFYEKAWRDLSRARRASGTEARGR